MWNFPALLTLVILNTSPQVWVYPHCSHSTISSFMHIHLYRRWHFSTVRSTRDHLGMLSIQVIQSLHSNQTLIPLLGSILRGQHEGALLLWDFPFMSNTTLWDTLLLTWDSLLSRKIKVNVAFCEVLGVSIDGQKSTVITHRLRLPDWHLEM